MEILEFDDENFYSESEYTEKLNENENYKRWMKNWSFNEGDSNDKIEEFKNFYDGMNKLIRSYDGFNIDIINMGIKLVYDGVVEINKNYISPLKNSLTKNGKGKESDSMIDIYKRFEELIGELINLYFELNKRKNQIEGKI
jgi:hypothetical protein